MLISFANQLTPEKYHFDPETKGTQMIEFFKSVGLFFLFGTSISLFLVLFLVLATSIALLADYIIYLVFGVTL